MSAALTFHGPMANAYILVPSLAFLAGWAWLAVKEWRG